MPEQAAAGFAPSLLLLIAFGYLALLFTVAAWGDRSSALAQHPRLRAWVYSLALGVYCTTWTVYGAVGSAVHGGWSFLPIYLGPILVFLFGFGLLERLVLVARQQNIGSLSHLLSARFGRSQPLAALVALIALCAAVPYIALQFKAIADSIEVLAPPSPSQPTLAVDTALYVALTITLFAILFGTREAGASGHRRGLLLAVALESVVKLLALLVVAWLAWRLGSGEWPGVVDRVAADARWAPGNWFTTSFMTQTLLAACAIVCLPRQFHIAIVECAGSEDLRLARRVFIGYLLLVSLAVLPIAWWAGGQNLAGHPDHLVLSLPLQQGAPWAALLAFIGGLSAGTAMVIVASVAVSTMISNDLLMPMLMRIRRLRLTERHDLSAIVLACRRLAITLLALMAFAFYRLAPSGDGSLASYGLLAFSAVAQFAPALLAALYWRNASRSGVLLGMLSGFALWWYTLVLPQLTVSGWFDAQWLAAGPFGIGWLAPQALFGLSGPDPLTHGTLWSLAVNIAVLLLVSWRRHPVLAERLQASAYLDPYGLRSSLAQEVVPHVRQGDLVDLARRIVGQEAARAAYTPFFGRSLDDIDEQAPADRRLLQFTERLLAGAVGSGSARVMLTSLLRGSGLELGEVVSALDETSQALRFNRGLLQTTFEHMSQGISVVDAEMRLVAWNRRYAELFDYPEGMLRIGRPIAELIRYNAERGQLGPGDVEQQIERRLAHMRAGSAHRYLRERADGRVLEMRGEPLPDGGFVMSFNDITEFKRVEAALREANETLEDRVELRTHELSAALAAQQQARREAQAAQETRTRFIAAASHDLLQPLSAARLFLSALVDDRQLPSAARDTVQRTDQALAAAEEQLDGLIDLARLDAGVLKPELRDFAVQELFEALERQFQPIAQSRGLRLRVLPTRLRIHSDRKLMHRIVQNFVANALRYTRQGGAVLGARRRAGDVLIEVWDSGPGIPPEVEARMFRDFEQGGASPWGERGMGLGLAGCLRLARLMRQDLALRSRPGAGTVSSIRAPRVAGAEQGRSPAYSAESPVAAAGLSILVLDNEPTVVESLAQLLGRWGHRVHCAANGEQAATILRGRAPQLALLDQQLDDGETGLDLWQQWGRAGIAPPRAAMLSGERSREFLDLAARLQLPVLHKPIKPAALRALLASCAQELGA